MKIMSFNTQHCQNYITKKIDFEVMAEAIKQCEADIVGLNEMRDAGVRDDYTAQVKILSELTGLSHCRFAKAIDDGPGNPYGNGFLSKYPIESSGIIIVPAPVGNNQYYETRCLLKIKLEGGITVLVIHFGLTPEEQINAVNTVVENIADEKCILMGDFNVTPEDELLLPIRERMKDTAELFDCEKFSFPSDNPRKKIDYIFVTPDIEVVSADIPDIVASDHRPHTAEIAF